MWLKLGEEELLNLDYCSSVRKEGSLSIELRYMDSSRNRAVRFEDEVSRNTAFERIVKNLVRMQKAME